MEHRIYIPFLLKSINLQALEQFLLSKEIALQCGYQQALAESARTAKKEYTSAMRKVVYHFCFIDIYISFIDNSFECLYSYRVLHNSKFW